MNKKKKNHGAKTDTRWSKTTCEDFSLLLAEYWEGEPDASLREEIEHHVKTCPDCAAVLKSYTGTIRVCRTTSREVEPRLAHEQFLKDLFRQIKALDDYLGK